MPSREETTLCLQGREQKVDSNQEPFTHPPPEDMPKTFEEAVNVLRPSAIIGKGGYFYFPTVWVLAAFNLLTGLQAGQ